MVFDGFPEGHQAEARRQVEGNAWFQGVSNFHPYNHLGCKIEASRLQDLKSEVEGLKVERISNLRLKG